MRRDKFGEGVYIGSAVSNWCTTSTTASPTAATATSSRATRSSQTTVRGRRHQGGHHRRAASSGNTFDGSALTGADSWVDVKGNNWLIQGNSGTKSTQDGFQTHQILKGWGDHNLFTGNIATVDGPGLGLRAAPGRRQRRCL